MLFRILAGMIAALALAGAAKAGAAEAVPPVGVRTIEAPAPSRGKPLKVTIWYLRDVALRALVLPRHRTSLVSRPTWFVLDRELGGVENAPLFGPGWAV